MFAYFVPVTFMVYEDSWRQQQ